MARYEEILGIHFDVLIISGGFGQCDSPVGVKINIGVKSPYGNQGAKEMKRFIQEGI